MLIQANILQSGASLFTQSSRQGVQLTPHFYHEEVIPSAFS